MAKAPVSQESQETTGLSLGVIVVIGLVAAGVMAFLMYYGWLNTPDKPWAQMR